MCGKNKYYSQNGEDYMMSKLFDEGYKGFFIDVGALDGSRFSNTLHFAERGWKGICIEAHPDYIEILKAARPESKVIHAAAGDEDRLEIDFYANSRGTFSTLDPKMEKPFKAMGGGYFTGFEKIKVPMVTLDWVLEQFPLPGIDIVSIDVEGEEPRVLKGFDLERHRPRVMCLEIFQTLKGKAITEITKKAGYITVGKGIHNTFFCRDEADACKLANVWKPKDVRLTWTKHPIDAGIIKK